MSEENHNENPPKPSVPKPDIPKPDIPKPDIPKPDIPKPNVPEPTLPAPSIGKTAPETPSERSFEPTAPTEIADFDDDSEEDEIAPVHAAEETMLHLRLLGAFIDLAISYGLMVAARAILPDNLDSAAYGLQIIYMLTRDALPFLDGQSIGKKMMKTRAVTSEGAPLTNNWQASVLRNILFLVPGIGPLIETIILYTREDKPERGLRLGDGFAKTKVIKELPKAVE